MIVGNRVFKDSGRTYIMAILNVTPDSFSDGGRYDDVDKALKHVEEMIKDGADIIDIGGQSTRPGAELISEEEELDRVMPILENIRRNYDIPISVDTFYYKVAREVISAGADMINDVWGLKYDNNRPGSVDKMAEVIGRTGVSVCIMHNSRCDYKLEFNKYGSRELLISKAIDSMIEEVRESVGIAVASGIARDRIMVDPGVGFAKDYNMNMACVANLSRMKKLGFPILLGVSEKSVIGSTTGALVGDRLDGTIATTVMAVMSGCNYVRVHDVKSNKRAVLMAEELLSYRV